MQKTESNNTFVSLTITSVSKFHPSVNNSQDYINIALLLQLRLLLLVWLVRST